MTRKKYTSKFKTKVVLEALKECSSVAELAQKYDIAPLKPYQLSDHCNYESISIFFIIGLDFSIVENANPEFRPSRTNSYFELTCDFSSTKVNVPSHLSKTKIESKL